MGKEAVQTLYLNPTELESVICELYLSQTNNKKYTPLFVHGPPGVGKTSIVNQCAETLNVARIDILASQMDPIDVRGLPQLSTTDNITRWSLPSYLPRDPKSKGIMFFDELSNAAPAVQNALLKLILDRCVEDYKIPDGWIIIAAGNRASDKAHVYRLSSALTSRFIHVDLMPELENWSQWASANGIAPEILSFLNFKRDTKSLLIADKFEDRAFPCPRTWEYSSDILKIGFKNKILQTMLEGTVGIGAAVEFIAFMNSNDRVDPEDVLKNPLKVPLPKNPDSMWALVSGLVPYAHQKEHIPALLKFALRIADADKEEFSMTFARRMLFLGKEVKNNMIACSDKKSNDYGSLWIKFLNRFDSIWREIKA